MYNEYIMYSCLNCIVGTFSVSPFCLTEHNVQMYTCFNYFCFIDSFHRSWLYVFLAMMSPLRQSLDRLFMVSVIRRDCVELL